MSRFRASLRHVLTSASVASEDGAAAAVTSLLLVSVAVVVSLGGFAPQEGPRPLEVRSGSGDAWVHPGDRLDLLLSRPLVNGQERLAVIIGETDWSSLFELTGQTLDYAAGPVRLPSGETTVTVYLVTSGNTWTQVATLPLKVTTPAGFERATIGPHVDLADTGQLTEAHAPAANAPPRHQFQDATAGLGLTTEHVRSGFTVATQTNLLGVTNQAQAPRFAALGVAAPQLDLADYLWTVERGSVKMSVGQGTFGRERHLAPGLASRGVSLTLRRSRADVTFSAFTGNSIVGFGNFLGVSASHDRIGLADIGVELLRQPGAARIEFSVLDGSRAPQSGFTQGRVSDAERSRGAAIRFIGSAQQQRFHLDTGVARSTFTNPADPLLAQGVAIVAVRPRTSDAIYLDSSYDLVKDRKLRRSATLTVTPSYRFERVDPLFASVGAPQGLRSDLFQHVFGIAITAGAAAAQVSQTTSFDNLRHVPSILRTDTAVTTANLVVPTGALGQPATEAAWYPTVTYTLNRSKQAGEGLPDNGGFKSDSQVPDQVNSVQTVRADWSVSTVRLGYFVTRSLQDNRQPGRETADFDTLVQGLSIGVSIGTRADVSTDLGLERASSREFAQLTRTGHVSVSTTWRTTASDTVTAVVNATAGRGPASALNDADDASLQYAHAFVLPARGPAKPRVQLFGRVTWQSSAAFQPIAEAPPDRRHLAAFSVGLTCSVF